MPHSRHGARKRVLKHLHSQKTALKSLSTGAIANTPDDPDPPQPLSPGMMQLKSFYG
jgi:hypothetical protein